ncbi:unknown [Prevotella sp. CAG:873]|nr:unknown [Prevotella sp. CAG:873]
MIYSKFSKWGVSLPMCSQKPDQALTEQRVRLFVQEAIARTQEQGNDPVQQAMQSEIHPGPIADSLHPEMSEAELLEWIMQTQEMQEALIMFRNQSPNSPEASEVEAHKMEQEEVEATDVEQLLLDLTVAQSDWT